MHQSDLIPATALSVALSAEQPFGLSRGRHAVGSVDDVNQAAQTGAAEHQLAAHWLSHWPLPRLTTIPMEHCPTTASRHIHGT